MHTTTSLAELERTLSNQEQSAKREATLTLGIGLLSLLLLSGYFAYAYSRFAEAMRPKEIVTLGQGMLEDRIPDLRAAIEQQIETQAPVWARDLSRQAIKAMPDVRKQAQEALVQQLSGMVDETVAISEDDLRTFLKSNREVLSVQFEALASNPRQADEQMERLVKLLDEEAGGRMNEDAEAYLGSLILMNDKLDRFKSGASLGPQELLEKRVLMLARRMQLDSIDNEPETVTN